jgi:triosephosphate isomerase
MRTPVIAGNWKMNLDRAAAASLARALRDGVAAGAPGRDHVQVGVAPPFPFLEAVVAALRGSGIFVAAQNLHPEEFGAFTGEVSAAMVRDVGCTHVIVGHSERRHLFRETSELVGRKVKSALAHGLIPILCVGETLAERRSGQTKSVVLDQLETGVRGLTEAQARPLIVAYEPVWAIGTGVNATPGQAGEVHTLVRDGLERSFSPGFAREARILYGGSVKPENAAELLAVDGVDGALVGGASLTAASFLGIIAACPRLARA